ncbi:MAG TPA: RNA polymerase sigma-70 factor [Bacteroidales bacterium]|nr:RNA polymerase sigma-70 factor [Bacteroidales bacterium]
MTGRENKSRSLIPEKGFEKIFREYFVSLTYYALKFTGDHDSAKEIVHQVFINIWEKRTEIEYDRSLRSYLYTAVHNRCLNFLRDRKQFDGEDIGTLAYGDVPAAVQEDKMEKEETEARISKAISSLPERCRKVFVLSRFEEKKYSEIASALGISVKTVEAQMSKALRLLRTELKDLISIFVMWIILRFFG